MENDWSWEQKTLINELIQGMEVATKLKADLRIPSSAETRDSLVQKILSSYDKAILILRWNASTSKSHTIRQATKTSSTQSPVFVGGSPLRENVDGALKDHQKPTEESKKRRMMSGWMDHVRVSSETGLEGPHEDGYSWRKYGQKDILGAKYPRSYYRCSFRNTRGCWATKQVQRSDEDPTIIDVTYRGEHTCCQGNNAVLLPKSQHKLEKLHRHNNDIHHAQQSVQESLAEFRNILTVDTDNVVDEEMASPFTFPSTSFVCMTQENDNSLPSAVENGSFLSSLSQKHMLSPNTPESNYFPSPFEFDEVYNKPFSESDIPEIISAKPSATNSPIFDFNFSLGPVEIDSNFPFNNPGFFS